MILIGFRRPSAINKSSDDRAIFFHRVEAALKGCDTALMERIGSSLVVPDQFRDAVIALGNFDGFHRGHQAVMAKARARAGAEGRPFIIVTLDPDLGSAFEADAPNLRLTNLDQRERLFRRAGADAMLVLSFDDELAGPNPEAHVADHLLAANGVSAMITWEDLTFAGGRAGNARKLAELCARHGIVTELVQPVADQGGAITTERIRTALAAGDCATATLLLTRPFGIEGIVQHGHKIGRTIGFPTANVLMGSYARPAYGVYAVRGRLSGGRVIDGVANLGIRPMMDPPEELLEPHFLDFTGDLYDQPIEVELIRYLRPEVKLSGLDELKDWIERDCAEARAVLAATPHTA